MQPPASAYNTVEEAWKESEAKQVYDSLKKHWGSVMESKFKVGQMVRIISEVNDKCASALSENFVAIGDVGVVRSFRESASGFNVDVQMHGKSARLYFKEGELEAVEVDECAATGQTCQFVSLSVPSVYTTGEEDGASCDVIQCKYCGRELGND